VGTAKRKIQVLGVPTRTQAALQIWSFGQVPLDNDTKLGNTGIEDGALVEVLPPSEPDETEAINAALNLARFVAEEEVLRHTFSTWIFVFCLGLGTFLILSRLIFGIVEHYWGAGIFLLGAALLIVSAMSFKVMAYSWPDSQPGSTFDHTTDLTNYLEYGVTGARQVIPQTTGLAFWSLAFARVVILAWVSFVAGSIYGLATLPNQIDSFCTYDEITTQCTAQENETALLAIAICFVVLSWPVMFVFLVGNAARITRGSYRVRVRLESSIAQLLFERDDMARTDSGRPEAILGGIDSWIVPTAVLNERSLSFLRELCCVQCWCADWLRENIQVLICLGCTFVLCCVGWPLFLLFVPMVFIPAITTTLFYACIRDGNDRCTGTPLCWFGIPFIGFALWFGWMVFYGGWLFDWVCPDSYLNGNEYTSYMNGTEVTLEHSRVNESFPCLFSRWVLFVTYVLIKILCLLGALMGKGVGCAAG